jgi:hypothetical protein
MQGMFSPRDFYLWFATRALLRLVAVAGLVGAALWLLHTMGRL